MVPAGEPSTYLGVRVGRAGLGPGEKLRRRMPDRVRAAAMRGAAALERTLRAYLGVLVPGGLAQWRVRSVPVTNLSAAPSSE